MIQKESYRVVIPSKEMHERLAGKTLQTPICTLRKLRNRNVSVHKGKSSLVFKGTTVGILHADKLRGQNRKAGISRNHNCDTN